MLITVAVCTYNRCERLPALVNAFRRQECPVAFEILIVNNNSTDHTLQILERLRAEPGPPLRFVTEHRQGIVPARNRALAEALGSQYLVFIDDDELPRQGFLAAVVACFEAHEAALCVGGRVKVDLSGVERPRWLNDDLLGFLAETDYGDQGFWVRDETTPLWTANIAYKTSLFRENGDLRFDDRYSRVGKGIGGGEDVIMFRELLKRGAPIRYCPEMVVDHAVETWRLRPSYFLKLHYSSGFKEGRWELDGHNGGFLGVPPFLFRQLLAQTGRTLGMLNDDRPGELLRQAMTAAHALGMILGCHARWRDFRQSPRGREDSGEG